MTDEEYLIKLGKKIARLRKEKGWTQAEFAIKLNTHRTNVTRIELGNVNSTINILRKIAATLDMRSNELLNIQE
jgi:transcriptional regulator with XRE-family HTH domain